jgi:predicted aldo/keto reductase-like oxidoreductase
LQYRKFGKLDWKVSALGFGTMRLPQTDNDMAHVDEPEAIQMIRYAIDKGVNYLDTAYPYHMGNSERVVGKALRDGYRQKIRLATKLTPHMVRSAQDLDRYLDGQLERLQTDKIDFYLMHGLNAEAWKTIQEFDALRWAEGRVAKGQLGHLGFSFHDEYEVFKKIVDGYDNWTFCQVQYNYLDENNQAGRRGVEYAAGKGLAVVVMEPLRGGLLAKAPPRAVAKVWKGALKKRRRVEWALQWVWNQPEISVALSGMSTMAQVRQNVTYASRSHPNAFTADDLALFKRVRHAYQGLAPIPCTDCRYCQPCPNGVEISQIFKLYNEVFIYDDPRMGYFGYASPMGLKEEQRADKCQECGECVKVCPQHLQIPDLLKKAHEQLTPKGSFGPPPGPPPV